MINKEEKNKPFNKRGPKGKRRGRREAMPREYEQKIVDLARVTRVTKGGKRMSFRVCLVIGDGKGKAGYGVAKGADVAIAVQKAFNQAKKNTFIIPLVNDTIAHEVRVKFGAAKLLLKPAPKGSGLKAGGAVRVVLELAGVPNAVAKILGTNNKINNVKASFKALKELRKVEKESKDKDASDSGDSRDSNDKPEKETKIVKGEKKKTVVKTEKKESTIKKLFSKGDKKEMEDKPKKDKA